MDFGFSRPASSFGRGTSTHREGTPCPSLLTVGGVLRYTRGTFSRRPTAATASRGQPSPEEASPARIVPIPSRCHSAYSTYAPAAATARRPCGGRPPCGADPRGRPVDHPRHRPALGRVPLVVDDLQEADFAVLGLPDRGLHVHHSRRVDDSPSYAGVIRMIVSVGVFARAARRWPTDLLFHPAHASRTPELLRTQV